ncbi:MAG: ethanolamine ammonia-lyase reactivating factor EutA [Flavobacteriales bacterium]|nr:ethanolamine ammonia-lyase reactivating factor EutA [Flavobacteriales bacterium]
MRFAAVDIGSNAVRLLFCDVYPFKDSLTIKKTSLVRLPIRLGEDVFSKKMVSKKNVDKLIKSIEAFKNLTEVYEVIDYRVCATSAMREAENGKDIIKTIKKQTGIEIEIIEGEIEAELIYQTHVAEKIDEKGCFLYVDVGGGSTELTLFAEGKKMMSKSFKIGTIRLKNNLVNQKTWKEMAEWVHKAKKKNQPSMIIATGGNINKLYKLCGLKDYKLMEYSDLQQMNSFLEKYSIEERINKLGLKPDRADVITHAGNIFLQVMKEVGVKHVFVPKVGLADGVIQELYNKHIGNK